MIFSYKNWEKFCKKLADNGRVSITAKQVFEINEKYTVLKHDVETDVKRALKIATIESKYGHKGSYYVQAYLLKDKKNVEMLKKMQQMGHEITYHYDVLDSCKGDFEQAEQEYKQNVELFIQNGFEIVTVCQHGNPIVDRVGYTSNRDFFRNEDIAQKFSNHSDIMVNFPRKANTNYKYYSDAGRKFNLIYDPFFNDVTNSDDKNVAFDNLDKLFQDLGEDNAIISMHPHRWCASAVTYVIKTAVFKVVKFFAKLLIKIPFMKKIMSKFYGVAKKF